MSNIGTLTIEMAANIARLQSDMDQAKRVVNESMQSIQQAVGLAQRAFIALAGVASVDAFTGMVRGSIDAAAAMGKLATQAGTTVEAMSGLASVGRLSGTSADTVAGAMNKMTKAMSGAGEDAKGAGAALKALGLNFDDFVKMSPDERMVTVAKAMDQFQDGAGKSGVAMALMGKSGAEMLPYMKDLAQVGELQAKVTADQAAQARDFNNNLLKVKATSEAWKKELSMGMLPALDEASKAYLAVMNSTGGLRDQIVKLSKDGTITQWTRDAITGLTYMADAAEYVWRGIKSLGLGFASLAAGVMQLAQGNFRGAATAFSAGWDDIGKAMSGETLGEKFRTRMADVKGLTVAVQDQRPALDANFNAVSKGKDVIDQQAKAYDSLLANLRSKIATNLLEADTGKALTEVQKIQIDIDKQVAEGKILESDASSELTKAILQEIEKSGASRDIAMDRVKATLAANEAQAKYVQSLDSGVKKLQEEIDAQRLHNAEIGLGKEAVAALNAAREEQKAVLLELQAIKALDKNSDEVTYTLLMREAAAIRELNKLKQEGAAKQVAVDEAKKADEAWVKFYDSLYNGLSDSLYRAFEKGNGFFSSFWQGIVNTFKTTVLKVAIQGVVGSVVGGLGLPGAASAAGATGMGSMLSGAGSLSSTFNAATGAGTFMGGISNGLSAWGSGGSVMNVLSNPGLYSGAEMLGAAMPAIGAALLAYKVITSLTGGETRTGSQFGYHPGSGIDLNVSPSGGPVTGADTALTTTVTTINTLLQSLGSKQTVAYFTGGLESSGAGKGFDYAGGVLSNNQGFGTGIDGQGYLNNRGSKSIEEATAAYTLDLKKATIDALKVATDIPKSVQDYLATVDTSALTDAAATDIVKNIAAVADFQKAIQTLPFEQLKNASFDTANALLGLSGGVEKFDANTQTYLQNFYSQAEQTAQATKNVTSALAAAGLQMPATRDEYRQLVEAQDLTTDAGRRNWTVLMQLAGAYAAVIPAASDNVAVLQKQHDWQTKLNVLLGITTDRQVQMEKDLASTTDAATQALIRQYYAQLDAQDAADKLTQALQKQADLQKTNQSWQDKIDVLMGTRTERQVQEANDLAAATDDTTRALIMQYYAQLDAADAAAKAAEAQRAAAAAMQQAYRDALTAQQTMLQGLVNFGTSVRDFLRGLDTSTNAGTTPQSRLDAARAQYLADLAGSRNGDAEAYKRLTQSAQTYMNAGSEFYGSSAAQQAIIAQIKAELGNLSPVKNLDANLEQLKAIEKAIQDTTGAVTGTLTPLEAIKASITSDMIASVAWQSAVAGILSKGFDTLDTNTSGGLSYAEFQVVMAGKASEKTIADMFKTLDKNGDGQLTQLELIGQSTNATAADTSNNVVPTLRQMNAGLHADISNLWLGLHTDLGVISGQLAGVINVRSEQRMANYPVFFKDGGVVNRTTAFGMAGGGLGIMGEAGEEAIMPIARTSGGQMGVRAVGNNGDVVRAVERLDRRLANIDKVMGGDLNITVVTPDGKALKTETLRDLRELSRKGEIVIYANGVGKNP